MKGTRHTKIGEYSQQWCIMRVPQAWFELGMFGEQKQMEVWRNSPQV